jgi:(p)ppGpp synthase/HD superfamily hydrolase
MAALSDRVDRAMQLAADLHRFQARKARGVPYLAHLWSVAALVAEQGGGEDEIIAALLHDAAEDQGGRETLGRIRAEFGDSIAQMVLECSDSLEFPKPPWRERKEAYLARCESAGPGVLRVSLADKIHNARSLLMELRRDGPSAFDLFRGGKEGTLWYYRRLVELFRRRTPGLWTEELARIVDQIESASAN